MAGIMDRYRRFAVDGAPVVTGFAAVGDAWACTNPSAGRWVSVGLVHSQVLRQTARDYLDEPAGFARALDEGTERVVAPFYWNQIRADRARLGGDDALREDRAGVRRRTRRRPMASPQPTMPMSSVHSFETVLCLALPQDVVERPGIKEIISNRVTAFRRLSMVRMSAASSAAAM